MVSAINLEDIDALQVLLEGYTGSLSEPPVPIQLPGQWNRRVLTSPLKCAIFNSDLSAATMLLASGGSLTEEDLNTTLAKILKNVSTHDGVKIATLLLQNGANVQSPLVYSNVFSPARVQDETWQEGEIRYDIVDAVCRHTPRNEPKGHLILALSEYSRGAQLSPQLKAEAELFSCSFAEVCKKGIRRVLASGFDPAAFLSNSSNWNSLGMTTFQRLLKVLPIFIQVMRTCPEEVIGMILRHASNMPLSTGLTDSVRLLGHVIPMAGYDAKLVLSVACLTDKRAGMMGFLVGDETKAKCPLQLQELSRIAVRNAVNRDNLYGFCDDLHLPTTMNRYLMLDYDEVPSQRPAELFKKWPTFKAL